MNGVWEGDMKAWKVIGENGAWAHDGEREGMGWVTSVCYQTSEAESVTRFGKRRDHVIHRWDQ